MERRELLRAIAGVPGWLSDEEAAALFELARACRGRGAIVELGSWRGRSTICLALGSKAGPGVPVVAIDRHTDRTFADFEQNVRAAGVAELVQPIRSASHEPAAGFTQPIELLFIDASHRYEDVRRDFDLWVPKVLEGGVVAMHDTTWAGSKTVSEESIYRSRAFRRVRFVPSSLTVAVKGPASVRDRLRSRRMLAVKRAAELGIRVRHRLPRRLVVYGRRLLGALAGRR